MKSNSVITKKRNVFGTIAVSAFLMALPSYAVATPGPDDSEYIPGATVGPEGPISSAGLEHGLELYEFDGDDTCVPGALQIRATFHNTTADGILKAELFSERDFMKSKGKLRRIRVPAKAEKTQICINLPAPGDFAVVGYHDRDGNRKLKKAWNFKPKEPYGLSNNPEIKALRLPKWSETRFAVPMTGADIDIYLVDLGDED
ncbi:DUF2141 domain-containing protein [Litorimonas sp. RW-G-Af-16]|uniref:DUF2141 domain-containing protein n=1 Tax=Litorimonas sp. RW-G-Af-16 TaxID=3241168 RepID=UPI00390C506D